MRRTPRTAVKVVASAVVVGIILATVGVLSTMPSRQEGSVIPSPDLSGHPIYSTYEFSVSENTINIGTQPLYLPTGLVTEVMKRDVILRGTLHNLGMEISYYPFLKGHDVNFFLKTGQLDVGVGGDLPAISAAIDYNVVITSLIQLGFTSIVADRPMVITQLVGKSIACPQGSNAHFALLAALGNEGITKDEVELVPMDVDEMQTALANGKIDAFASWEPFTTQAISANPKNIEIHRSLSSGYLYFTQTFADRHPQAVRQIIAAEIRAIRWMRNDRGNLLKASQWAIRQGNNRLSTDFGLSPEQTADIAMRDILGMPSEPIIPRSFFEEEGLLQKEFVFLKRLGEISASAEWVQVFGSIDRETTLEVLANSDKYRLLDFEYDSD